jgi:hypothetical protein
VRASVLDPGLETNSVGSHVEDVSSLSFLLVVLLPCLLRLRHVTPPPSLGVTMEIMSRGPHVVDMECRELY